MDSDRKRFDAWQLKAVTAWQAAGYLGIVQAVTGSGKTHVAHKAIRHLRNRYPHSILYPVIAVPTRALLHQWKRSIEAELPTETVGIQGDGSKDTFGSSKNGKPVSIIVATIYSAVTALENGLLSHCIGQHRSFLIADECHHVLSPTAKLYPKVLEHPYDFRLGLTATLETWSLDGLGETVYEYTLATAVKDGVIPELDIVNVGVDLGPQEKANYFKLSEAIGAQFAQVCSAFGLFGCDDRIWIELHALAEDEPSVRALFGLVFRRAEIVYTAAAKLHLAPDLIRLMVAEHRRKALVFFERIWTVDDAAMGFDDAKRLALEVKSGVGDTVETFLYHSGLSAPGRDAMLDNFCKAGPSALLACRALDEGIDVPTVDGAIIVAATQSRRALIQRIGRTLRQVPGKARPLVALLYAKGTGDIKVEADDYFKQEGITIHDVAAKDARSLIGRLLDGSYTGAGVVIADMEKTPKLDLLPTLGELSKLKPTLRIERFIGSPLEGTLHGVLKKRRACIGPNQQWVALDSIRRVLRL